MKGPRFWAIMAVAGVALFGLSFTLRPIDESVGQAIVGARGLVLLAGGLAFLGAISFVAPAVILGSVTLVYFGRLWGAVRLVGGILLGELVSRTLKMVFARPRPEYMLVETGGFSFPSGHATLGAAVAVLIVWFAGRHVKGQPLVVALLVGALVWTVAMAGARLVQGVHYLSDVVGGIGVGLACASAVILATILAEPRLTFPRPARVRRENP